MQGQPSLRRSQAACGILGGLSNLKNKFALLNPGRVTDGMTLHISERRDRILVKVRLQKKLCIEEYLC